MYCVTVIFLCSSNCTAELKCESHNDCVIHKNIKLRVVTGKPHCCNNCELKQPRRVIYMQYIKLVFSYDPEADPERMS